MAAAVVATISAPERSEAGRVPLGERRTESTNEAAEDRQVVINGVPVHYESRGSGQTIVMIHGLTLDRR